MTARDIVPLSTSANPNCTTAHNDGECELNRKRSLFLDFCADWLLAPSQQGANAIEEDQLLAELFKNPQAPSVEVINDLPGVLSARAPTAGAGAIKLEQVAADSAEQEQAPAADTAFVTSTAAAAGRPLYHRAVVTSMPMPATTRAAAAGAGNDDDDTSSVRTLPMPSRKRRRSDEDDEACSSPNDLVEVPAAQPGAAGRKRKHAAAAAGASAGGRGHQDDSSMRDQSTAAGAGSSSVAAQAASAASPDVHKGILVAKVLTKSDANSKRVILPRIAVETNLPQLASAQHFHFSATDPTGQSWPLVIKAWANGSNPKPVYVMEMIGDVLKNYKLTIGDAIALLADQEGNFYLEWNTPGAAAAAARPTYSGIVFKDAKSSGSSSQAAQQQQQQQQEPEPAAAPAPSEPAAPAAVKVEAPTSSPFAAAAEQPAAPVPAVIKLEQQLEQQQQQRQRLSPPAAVPLPAASQPPAAAVASMAEVQQQQHYQQLPVSSNMPFMTAVPVTQPQVPGTFIPTSPCQLLVMGHMPMPDLDLDLDASGPGASTLQPSLPSGMLGNLNSNGDVVMPAAAAVYGGSLEPASQSEAEALLVPAGALPQLAHSGGVLLCPRTPGCTRPAGHQGWCLGHKGYKKRRV